MRSVPVRVFVPFDAMLNIETHTMFVMMITTCFALSAAIFLIGIRRHQNLLVWAVALGALGVAYTILGFRGTIPALWSITLGNLALSVAMALFAEAIYHFQQRRPSRWMIWSPVAGVLMCMVAPLGSPIRALVLGALLVAQCFIILGSLAAKRSTNRGRGQYLLAAGAFIAITIILLRVAGAMMGRESTMALLAINATALLSMTGVLWLSVGLLIMNKDRAEQALRDSQTYEQFRNHILELLSRGTDARNLLTEIVKGIEILHPQMICSVLLVQADGQHLGQGIAPSLPSFYNDAVEGLAIADRMGCCGTAAYTGQAVVVENIAEHPYWEAFKDTAREAGLASCWSQPIRSSTGSILGTFAIYHRHQHSPTLAHMALIEQTAQLASIAIERSKAADQLRASEYNYRQLIQTANEGISVIQDGLFRFVNPKFCDILGVPADELLNHPFMAWVEPEDHDYVITNHQRRLRGESDGEVFTLHANTRHRGKRWIEISGCKFDWHGRPGTLNFVTDVTERVNMENRIRELAYHDTLTGLPNRRLLDDHLALALSSNHRTGTYGALMFLDLDNFKPLNDTHGHGVGDQLLMEVGQRLLRCVRASDTVARFGGDEFVILLNALSTNPTTAAQDAEHVAMKVLSTLSAPYSLRSTANDTHKDDGNGSSAEVVHHCTASIGVALFLADEGSPDDFLIRADSAMYQAKAAGRNTIRFHAP